MDAASWIDHLRAFDDDAERLLDYVAPFPERSLWDDVGALDARVAVLGETIGDALPLPALGETPDAAEDRAMSELLDATLRGTEPPGEAVDLALSTERAGRGDGGPTVPLGDRSPTAANWYVFVPWFAARLDDVGRKFDRFRGRLSALDHGTLAAVFGDVGEALADVASYLRYTATRTLWLNPPDRLADAEYERVRAFVLRTVESYNLHA